ncbi:MAG: hypothetical protein HYS38_07025 [Acidobacteria bacterium]|nr:hypothetical protein [Acidobacteriota bacterium]
MKIDWSIDESDVEAVCELLAASKEKIFVKNRIERNVSGLPPAFSRERFWYVMMGCLLTTQQRSGPGSPVNSFLKTEPFPLTLAQFDNREPNQLVEQVIRQFGGIRMSNTIANRSAENLRWLKSEGWGLVEKEFDVLLKLRSRDSSPQDAQRERQAAAFIDKYFKGFGPKQSRNLWQWLGLTRFEIPLDSRITKWLNENILSQSSLKLRPTALADQNYYEFVMDGVQALCQASSVLPCVLDAAIFSSYDREWLPEELDN